MRPDGDRLFLQSLPSDSNRQPSDYETDALPIAPERLKSVTGIEPVSSAWKAEVLAVTPHGHIRGFGRRTLPCLSCPDFGAEPGPVTPCAVLRRMKSELSSGEPTP